MVRLLRSWWALLTTDVDRQVSEAWLLAQRRQASRVEFHGVQWRWPIQKLED